MKRFLYSLFILSFLIATPVQSSTPPLEFNKILSSNIAVRKYQEKSRKSSVKVLTNTGHGSGTLVKIKNDFYVLTARHVIETSKIVIIEAFGETTLGSIEFKSENQDIALVKLVRLKNNKSIKISPLSNRPKAGTELVYSGFPSGYNLFTAGAHIAGFRDNRYILQGFAWPGSSGAGAIDDNGDLIGVVVAIGVDWVRGNAQLIETVVWMEPINESTMKEISKVIEL